MPEEEIELPASDEKGWLGKIKESIYQNWQTILVALIVLIVGISAYNYNEQTGTNTPAVNEEENAQGNDAEESNGQEAATTENQEENTEQTDQEAAQAENQGTTEQTETTTPQSEETKTEETNTNIVESNGDGYKVTAEKGEGITHLARKALAQYLSENSDSEVTALHKIYIEDYLQNKIGSQGIEVGHAETISKASIQEAIAASKNLSQASLDNLKKYSIQ